MNEALIFGMPVLCSQYAGAASLITPERGILFDPKNRNDTLEKTERFLEMIQSVKEVRLAERPSLMGNYQLQFNKEWEKLT
ncbi:hypothetical protein SDC9_177404 [bioreactor metagenome]|uniref:Glycosyl transferase family 1 domain-containing protein n=1 Tax=bioreactor metagenome TaxID=1076179 RepID=A0A645GSQ9_9ZZZZ